MQSSGWYVQEGAKAVLGGVANCMGRAKNSMMRTGIYSLVELLSSLIVLFGNAEALYASVSPRNGVLTADSENDLAS